MELSFFYFGHLIIQLTNYPKPLAVSDRIWYPPKGKTTILLSNEEDG